MAGAVIKAFEKAGLEYIEGVYTGPARDLNGTRYEYAGVVSETAAITPAGTLLNIDSITTAVLNDDDTLVISCKDGSIIELPPARLSDEMRLRIRNISRGVSAVYKMPKSDSELNDLFPLVFPDYKQKMHYDLLRERERIDLSIFLYGCFKLRNSCSP